MNTPTRVAAAVAGALVTTTTLGISPAHASSAKPTAMPVIAFTAQSNALQPSAAVLRPGWTRITLTNNDREPHQAAVVRLPTGMSAKQFLSRFSTEGERALAGTIANGGPAIAFPGSTSSVAVNLAPGTYIAADLAPGADGKPRATKGFISAFEVKTKLGARPVAKPQAVNTVELHDFFFAGNVKLHHGTTIEVRNDGSQPHEVVMFSVAPGKTSQDVIEFFTPGAPAGPPPFTAATGISGLAPKAVGYLNVDVPVGKVVFMCFLPNINGGGEPHFTKGMVAEGEVIA